MFIDQGNVLSDAQVLSGAAVASADVIDFDKAYDKSHALISSIRVARDRDYGEGKPLFVRVIPAAAITTSDGSNNNLTISVEASDDETFSTGVETLATTGLIDGLTEPVELMIPRGRAKRYVRVWYAPDAADTFTAGTVTAMIRVD